MDAPACPVMRQFGTQEIFKAAAVEAIFHGEGVQAAGIGMGPIYGTAVSFQEDAGIPWSFCFQHEDGIPFFG